jgi:hypothetical protein
MSKMRASPKSACVTENRLLLGGIGRTRSLLNETQNRRVWKARKRSEIGSFTKASKSPFYSCLVLLVIPRTPHNAFLLFISAFLRQPNVEAISIDRMPYQRGR